MELGYFDMKMSNIPIVPLNYSLRALRDNKMTNVSEMVTYKQDFRQMN